jgi:hypothetical protein
MPKTGMYARFLLVSAQQRALAGEPAAGLALARRAQRLIADLALPCHVGAWAADAAIVDFLQRMQRFEETAPELVSLDQCASADVDETPYRVAATLAHARDALGRSRPAEGLDFANTALRRIEGSEDRAFYVLDAAEAHRLAGAAYVGLNQAAEARTELKRALALLEPYQVPASPRLVQVRAALQALN